MSANFRKGDLIYSGAIGLSTVIDGRRRRHTDGDAYMIVVNTKGETCKQWLSMTITRLTQEQYDVLARLQTSDISYLIREFVLAKMHLGHANEAIAQQLKAAASIVENTEVA